MDIIFEIGNAAEISLAMSFGNIEQLSSLVHNEINFTAPSSEVYSDLSMLSLKRLLDSYQEMSVFGTEVIIVIDRTLFLKIHLIALE